MPREDKLAYVESILDLMDMQGYADAVVGVPGEGLNVEQRKRLTIAVEMVAKPELLLFLGMFLREKHIITYCARANICIDVSRD